MAKDTNYPEISLKDFNEFAKTYKPSEPVVAKPKGSLAKDLMISGLKGVVNIPEAAVGLADIVTLGRAGKALDAFGVNFRDIKNNIDDYYGYSQEQKDKQAQVSGVFRDEGFLAGMGAAIKTPSVIATNVVESLPGMIGGSFAGRGVAKGLTKILGKEGLKDSTKETIAAIGAGAGEGLVMAGSQAEQIRQQSPDGYITGKQALGSAITGLVGGAIGAGSGKLASTFGFEDLEMAIARGGFRKPLKEVSEGVVKKNIPLDILAKTGKSATQEGLFEELPQSVFEQGMLNTVTDKPIGEGMAEAAGMGLLSGTTMGGVFGGGHATLSQVLANKQNAPSTTVGSNIDAEAIVGSTGEAGRVAKEEAEQQRINTINTIAQYRSDNPEADIPPEYERDFVQYAEEIQAKTEEFDERKDAVIDQQKRDANTQKVQASADIQAQEAEIKQASVRTKVEEFNDKLREVMRKKEQDKEKEITDNLLKAKLNSVEDTGDIKNTTATLTKEYDANAKIITELDKVVNDKDATQDERQQASVEKLRLTAHQVEISKTIKKEQEKAKNSTQVNQTTTTTKPVSKKKVDRPPLDMAAEFASDYPAYSDIDAYDSIPEARGTTKEEVSVDEDYRTSLMNREQLTGALSTKRKKVAFYAQAFNKSNKTDTVKGKPAKEYYSSMLNTIKEEVVRLEHKLTNYDENKVLEARKAHETKPQTKVVSSKEETSPPPSSTSKPKEESVSKPASTKTTTTTTTEPKQPSVTKQPILNSTTSIPDTAVDFTDWVADLSGYVEYKHKTHPTNVSKKDTEIASKELSDLYSKHYLAKFRETAKKGYYSQWYKNVDKQDGFDPEAIREDVWNLVATETKEKLSEIGIISSKNGDVSITADSPLLRITDFNRLIVGAHGVYIELNAVPVGSVDKGMAPVGQYHNYSYKGIKVYDQKKEVNYAPYVIGKVYVAVEAWKQLPTTVPSVDKSTTVSKTDKDTSIAKVNKILDAYNWPKELRDAVKVIYSTASTLLPSTDMSAKSHLAKFGVTGMAVNWVLKNQAKVKLGTIKSEQQVRKLAEKQLAEKQDKSKYPALKDENLATNFDAWIDALKTYDPYFADMMFDYTLKLLTNERRDNKGVPQVNKAILAEVYNFAINNPDQLGYGKEYERKIVATATEASSHEKSASGKGEWIHIPRSPENGDQRKANIKLLECLSPETWCTTSPDKGGFNAPNSVSNYDNYILVVNGKTVAGLEVNKNGQLYDATSIANNRIASIDWLDDTMAFLDKHKINYKGNFSINEAKKHRDQGKDDAFTAQLGDIDDYFDADFMENNGDDWRNDPQHIVTAERVAAEELIAFLDSPVYTRMQGFKETGFITRGTNDEELSPVPTGNIAGIVGSHFYWITKDQAKQLHETASEIVRRSHDEMEEGDLTIDALDAADAGAASLIDYHYRNMVDYRAVKENAIIAARQYAQDKKDGKKVISEQDFVLQHLNPTWYTYVENGTAYNTNFEVRNFGTVKYIGSKNKILITKPSGLGEIFESFPEWGVTFDYHGEGTTNGEYFKGQSFETKIANMQATTDEPYTRVEGYNHARVQKADGIRRNEHRSILGKDYTGYYIHAYGHVFGLDTHIEKISDKEAVAIWEKDKQGYFNPDTVKPVLIDYIKNNPNVVLTIFKANDDIQIMTNSGFGKEAIQKAYEEVLPFSKRTTGDIEGWATGDSAVVNAAVVDPKDVGKVALHEVAHLGMIRLAQSLGGMQELHKILKSAKTELMKAVPELLKRTGHTSLTELAVDYGYDVFTEEGDAKILVELTARWAEKFESIPPAKWWTKLINDIKVWYKNLVGKVLTEKEVDIMVAEMIRYGSTNQTSVDKPITIITTNKTTTTTETNDLIKQFTNHSGGAMGSDTVWDQIGRKFGFLNHKHHREPLHHGQKYHDNQMNKNKTIYDPNLHSIVLKQAGIKPTRDMTNEDYAIAQGKASLASEQMGLFTPKQKNVKHYLKLRNWMQVKNADAIFAVGEILSKGTKWTEYHDVKTALIEQVKGDTGLAVQMAINEGKPVFVFNTKNNQWYAYSADTKTFQQYNDIPVLTPNYAGIGTRQITKAGETAIETVYANTVQYLAEHNALPKAPKTKPVDLLQELTKPTTVTEHRKFVNEAIREEEARSRARVQEYLDTGEKSIEEVAEEFEESANISSFFIGSKYTKDIEEQLHDPEVQKRLQLSKQELNNILEAYGFDPFVDEAQEGRHKRFKLLAEYTDMSRGATNTGVNRENIVNLGRLIPTTLYTKIQYMSEDKDVRLRMQYEAEKHQATTLSKLIKAIQYSKLHAFDKADLIQTIEQLGRLYEASDIRNLILRNSIDVRGNEVKNIKDLSVYPDIVTQLVDQIKSDMDNDDTPPIIDRNTELHILVLHKLKQTLTNTQRTLLADFAAKYNKELDAYGGSFTTYLDTNRGQHVVSLFESMPPNLVDILNNAREEAKKELGHPSTIDPDTRKALNIQVQDKLAKDTKYKYITRPLTKAERNVIAEQYAKNQGEIEVEKENALKAYKAQTAAIQTAIDKVGDIAKIVSDINKQEFPISKNTSDKSNIKATTRLINEQLNTALHDLGIDTEIVPTILKQLYLNRTEQYTQYAGTFSVVDSLDRTHGTQFHAGKGADRGASDVQTGIEYDLRYAYPLYYNSTPYVSLLDITINKEEGVAKAVPKIYEQVPEKLSKEKDTHQELTNEIPQNTPLSIRTLYDLFVEAHVFSNNPDTNADIKRRLGAYTDKKSALYYKTFQPASLETISTNEQVELSLDIMYTTLIRTGLKQTQTYTTEYFDELSGEFTTLIRDLQKWAKGVEDVKRLADNMPLITPANLFYMYRVLAMGNTKQFQDMLVDLKERIKASAIDRVESAIDNNEVLRNTIIDQVNKTSDAGFIKAAIETKTDKLNKAKAEMTVINTIHDMFSGDVAKDLVKRFYDNIHKTTDTVLDMTDHTSATVFFVELYNSLLLSKATVDPTPILKRSNIPDQVSMIFKESITLTDDEKAVQAYYRRRAGGEGEIYVGKFRSKMTQMFFTKVAAIFGAQLVVVRSVGTDKAHSGTYMSAMRGRDGEKVSRNTIVINTNSKTNLLSILAHEVFHSIFAKVPADALKEFVDTVEKTLQKDSPEQWERYKAAIVKAKVAWASSNYTVEARYKEEVLAEFFSDVVTSSTFWNYINSLNTGKSLGRYIITKIMYYLNKITELLNLTDKRRSMFDHKSFGLNTAEIYDAVGTLLLRGYRNRVYEDDSNYEVLAAIDIGDITEPVRKYVADIKPQQGEEKILSTLNRIFVKVKDSTLGTVFVKMAQHAFGDLGAKKSEVVDAYKAVNQGRALRASLQIKYKKYRELFSSISKPDHMVIQNMLRGYAYNADGTKKTREVKNNKGKVLHTYHVKTANLAVNWGLMESLYGKGVVTFFKDIKIDVDAAYTKLQEIFPDLEKRTNHYGQSFKWFFEGAVEDRDVDLINPFYSKLLGSEQFLKSRSSKALEELMYKKVKNEDGILVQSNIPRLSVKTMNPLDVFIEYMSDVEDTVALRRIITEKMMNGTANAFYSATDAAKHGFVAVNDNSTKILDTLFSVANYYLIDKDGKPLVVNGTIKGFNNIDIANEFASRHGDGATVKEFNINDDSEVAKLSSVRVYQYQVVKPDDKGNKVPIGNATTKALAEDYIKKNKIEDAEVVAVESDNPTVEIAKVYFHPDFARLLNNHLSEDKIRNNYIGRKILDYKNAYTMWELGLSLFHGFTIGQELTSSFASYSMMTQHINKVGTVPLANMRTAWQHTESLHKLYEAVLADPTMLHTKETQTKISGLMGANFNFLDALNMYHLVGGMVEQDQSLLSTLGNKGHMDYKNITKSVLTVWNNEVAEAKSTNIKTPLALINAKAFVKTAAWTALQGSTQFLFETIIPKIKFAQFIREYSVALVRNEEALKAGTITKEEIAIEVMKFVEDRFGEVNWNNLWMNKTLKSVLIGTFRSFTWVLGSYKALGKGGGDLFKYGILKLQGKEAHLTEKGWWALMAIASHIMTGLAFSAMYLGVAALGGSGGDDDERDKEVPWYTRLLFPKIDPYDSSKRVSIPSYVTEFYKILSHLGFLNNSAEYSKLVSGRFNGLLSSGVDLMFSNTDFKGRYIRDPEDNFVVQMKDALAYLMPVPIVVKSMYESYKSEELSADKFAIGILGLNDAPASAKRSVGSNYAYELARNTYGKKIGHEEAKHKDEIAKAMYAYKNGDRTKLDTMFNSGKLSLETYKHQLARLQRIDGIANPAYVDDIVRVVRDRLTIDEAIGVFRKASTREKIKLLPEINVKYRNMMSRQDKGFLAKQQTTDMMRKYIWVAK